MKRILAVPLLLTMLLAALGPVEALDRHLQVKVMSSVVQISWITEERDGLYGAGVGSGTIVSPDGLILTNCHVADPLRIGYSPDSIPRIDHLGVSLTIRSDQLPKLSYLAEVVAADPKLDLAVIRITHNLDGSPVNPASLNLPYLERGDSNELEIGDELNIFGYPGICGETLTFTRGVVSGFTLDASITGRAWIKTDTTIAGGNSGGTAVNQDGLLVGVPTEAGRGGLQGKNEYVDCRPVADTNGNGRLDSGDTCVPIGGFINALRPVNLAESLIQAARAGLDYQGSQPSTPSTPTGRARLSNLLFSPGVNQFDQPTTVIYSLPSGSRSLYLFFDYEQMVDGTMVEMVATLNGREMPDLAMPPTPWNGGAAGSWWIGYEDQDLLDGTLALTLYVDGTQAGQAQIRIGGRPENLPSFSNLLFALSESPDGGPREPSILFPAGTTLLYAFFDYANMSRNLSWTSTWLADGEVALSEDEPWDGQPSGTYSIELTIRGGLAPGAYRLDLYIEDRLAATSNFWVTGEPGSPGSGARFEPILFAEGIDRRGNPVGVAASFRSGLEELHAFAEYTAMNDGMSVVVNWYLDGEMVVEWPFNWDSGETGMWHDSLFSRSGPLPDGEYGVELVVEGQVLQQASTVLGSGSRPTPTPSPQTGSGIPSYGTVSDADTGRPISGASLLLLNPGVTVSSFNWVDEQIYTSAQTDRTGYFEFPRPLQARTCYSIIVAAAEYWPFAQDDVCLPADLEEAELTVQLEHK
ncbi:MAG TPA: trypsin-like peptidase domain-containing protein [Anaerolineae bacterium]|nr:trypsin-like peptidase domain-containing protein [Anaerolineae bacterium]